jgi:exopolysaccharide production protein ExoQ
MNSPLRSRPQARQVSGRDTRFSLLTAAVTWLMVILMIVPGSLDYASASDTVEAGNPVTRAVWLAILAITVIITCIRLAMAMRLLRQVNIFFLFFVALAVSSYLWSIAPDLTLRRIVRLATMCSVFVAVAIAAWNPRRFQQLVRPVLTLMLIGSIGFGLIWPELAIHQETSPELLNAWHGLATQKNELGALASFGFVLWVHAWLARETTRLKALVGLAASGACLVLSRSSTSLMATAFASFALLLLMSAPGSLRRSMPYLVALLTVFIFTYSLAMLRVVPGSDILLSPIPMITGKDLTFSGRADIWAAIVDHISLRPLLGSGYGAYWSPGGPTPAAESYVLLQVLRGFYPGSSHNGYLDVLNDLGTVGLLCLASYLVVYLRQSLRLFALDRTQGALFLGLFLQQAITNLSEIHWFSVTSLDFVLMSLATTCLARALLESRMPRTPVARGPGARPPARKLATVPTGRLLRPNHPFGRRT